MLFPDAPRPPPRVFSSAKSHVSACVRVRMTTVYVQPAAHLTKLVLQMFAFLNKNVWHTFLLNHRKLICIQIVPLWGNRNNKQLGNKTVERYILL